MADDTRPLIERLRAWKSLRACDFEENSPLAEDLEAAAQALSHLTAFPLPEEIARLAGWLRECVRGEFAVSAANALQQQAREIERLRGIEEKGAVYFFDKWDDERENSAQLRARIRELEAERDRLIHRAESAERAAGALEKRAFAAEKFRAERDTQASWLQAAHKEMGAIRAKTIEEIVARIQATADAIPGVTADGKLMKDTCLDIMDAIRALNQPPEAGEGGKE